MQTKPEVFPITCQEPENQPYLLQSNQQHKRLFYQLVLAYFKYTYKTGFWQFINKRAAALPWKKELSVVKEAVTALQSCSTDSSDWLLFFYSNKVFCSALILFQKAEKENVDIVWLKYNPVLGAVFVIKANYMFWQICKIVISSTLNVIHVVFLDALMCLQICSTSQDWWPRVVRVYVFLLFFHWLNCQK